MSSSAGRDRLRRSYSKLRENTIPLGFLLAPVPDRPYRFSSYSMYLRDTFAPIDAAPVPEAVEPVEAGEYAAPGGTPRTGMDGCPPVTCTQPDLLRKIPFCLTFSPNRLVVDSSTGPTPPSSASVAVRKLSEDVGSCLLPTGSSGSGKSMMSHSSLPINFTSSSSSTSSSSGALTLSFAEPPVCCGSDDGSDNGCSTGRSADGVDGLDADVDFRESHHHHHLATSAPVLRRPYERKQASRVEHGTDLSHLAYHHLLRPEHVGKFRLPDADRPC
uniref:Uncharacterized protein n=1 Tax=Anopheles farauti TaxID=69004 RepID=A0A182QAE9_9DIPT